MKSTTMTKRAPLATLWIAALSLCFSLPLDAPLQAVETKGSERNVSESFTSSDWPWWRGPQRSGVALGDQRPPLAWSETQNIVWNVSVPGRGHGSPTVVGEQVFLATADEQKETQSVLCYDRRTGNRMWQTEVHQGGFPTKGNKKASMASSTVACDGERLFINFLHDGAVYTTALDRQGKQLWQTKISDYIVHQGYGSSPAVYGPLVIVTADNKGGGAIAGLDRTSGKIVWKHQRPKTPNYSSPVILNAFGREQLILTGCDLVASYAPLTGEKLWEFAGATTECVTSTVTDGQLIYSTGGYPKNHVAAMRADGTGTVAWENNTRVYVPSMVIRDGYLYAVADAGIAICWKADTGETLWKGRIAGTFSSSPILVGDKVFVTSESGTTYIFLANPDEFKLIGENTLGNEVYATPTICGNRIYMRVAERRDGARQEMLYCIGNAIE
jgi:outer membrane protein assembly factor BamB